MCKCWNFQANTLPWHYQSQFYSWPNLSRNPPTHPSVVERPIKYVLWQNTNGSSVICLTRLHSYNLQEEKIIVIKPFDSHSEIINSYIYFDCIRICCQQEKENNKKRRTNNVISKECYFYHPFAATIYVIPTVQPPGSVSISHQTSIVTGPAPASG